MDKAKMGTTITWTSATFSPWTDGMKVRVKEAIVTETLAALQECLERNLVTRKKLRTILGKSMHIASLVPTLRPFLGEMYAALYSSASGPAGNTVWTKQIRHAVTWLIAFLTESEGLLERTFSLATFQGHGKQVTMCLEASPWGLGGYLVEDNTITSWFSCGISDVEEEILQISVAESAAQQVVEALAVLVALRGWKDRWMHERIQLRVKSDSISALVLTLNLKTSGHGTSIVARELALDIAHSEYRPSIAEHIPGVENVIADALSRRLAPGFTFVFPPCLLNVPELKLPTRRRDYYRTLQDRPPVA
jgi:hypothetical protein